MKNAFPLIYTILFSLLLVTACKSTKKDAYSPVGSWSYTVSNTPMGDVSGVMEVTRADGAYKVSLSTSDGTIPLEDVKIEDNKITGMFDYDGNSLNMTGTFAGEEFTGEVAAGYDGFPMKATRKP